MQPSAPACSTWPQSVCYISYQYPAIIWQQSVDVIAISAVHAITLCQVIRVQLDPCNYYIGIVQLLNLGNPVLCCLSTCVGLCTASSPCIEFAHFCGIQNIKKIVSLQTAGILSMAKSDISVKHVLHRYRMTCESAKTKLKGTSPAARLLSGSSHTVSIMSHDTWCQIS